MPNRCTMPAGRRQSCASAAVTAAAVAAILSGCGSSSHGASGAPTTPSVQTPSVGPSSAAGAASPTTGASGQTPVSAEHNPPGDIPDTTVYVLYRSSVTHAAIKVPEGWARQDSATGSTFASNLNSITIAAQPMTSAPTVATARSTTVPKLSASTPAFRLQSVGAVTLAGGPAIEIVYQVNSQPNAVTGRQYRLVVERFEFFRNGRAAVLSLSSAVGSDNVDPWRIVSQSFRWA
jgi:hypothetical protein